MDTVRCPAISVVALRWFPFLLYSWRMDIEIRASQQFPVLLQSSNRSIYYAKLEIESRCVPESVTL